MEKEVALKFQNSKIQISRTSVKTTTPNGEIFETKYIVTIGDLEQEKYLSIILERYDLERVNKAILYMLGK